MNLELNDVQAEALSRELSHLIENDRYPLSPRIVALKEILGMLRPEPARLTPQPPRQHYEPPNKADIGSDVRHRQCTALFMSSLRIKEASLEASPEIGAPEFATLQGGCGAASMSLIR